MPLLRFKPLLMVLLALTLFSAVGGAAVYYMHLSVLRSLAEPLSLGESLDRVEYLEYEVIIGDERYLVKVYNDPGTRSGVSEIYREDTLLYKIRYTYGENTLLSITMERPDGSTEDLDPVQYEEAFFTSVSLETGPGGELTASPFPGVGPLQAAFFVTRSMGVNWDSFIKGTGPGVPVNISVEFRGVETPLGTSRGVHVTITPQNPVLAINQWMKGPLAFEVGRVGDIIVVPRMSYQVVLAQGGGGVSMVLLDIELEG